MWLVNACDVYDNLGQVTQLHSGTQEAARDQLGSSAVFQCCKVSLPHVGVSMVVQWCPQLYPQRGAVLGREITHLGYTICG